MFGFFRYATTLYDSKDTIGNSNYPTLISPVGILPLLSQHYPLKKEYKIVFTGITVLSHVRKIAYGVFHIPYRNHALANPSPIAA
jgi:hypothetical protein